MSEELNPEVNPNVPRVDFLSWENGKLRARADRAEADLAAWRDRFRALVDEDRPDTAGNRVITLRADLAAARQKIEGLRVLLARAESWVGISVQAVEDDPETGKGYETKEYEMVDKLRDEIAAALGGKP